MEEIISKEDEKKFEPSAALLGSFQLEGEPKNLYWLSLVIEQARLGLLSDNNEHPFINKVKQHQREQNFVNIHFKYNYPLKSQMADDYVNIVEFEKCPTAPGNDYIEKQRRRWVQLYLKFLAYYHKIPRAELVPRVSYNQLEEGPLTPYIQAINDMPSSQHKNVLLAHMEKLSYVHWYRSEEDGFILNLAGDDSDEVLEHLIIGGWSIFAAMTLRETMFPVFYIIELCEKVMPTVQLGLRREILEEFISLMTDLTFAPFDNTYGTPMQIHPLACMLIRSPMLFPLIKGRLKHLMIEKPESDDYNLYNRLPAVQSMPLETNEVYWETYEGDKHFLTKLKLNVDDVLNPC